MNYPLLSCFGAMNYPLQRHQPMQNHPTKHQPMQNHPTKTSANAESPYKTPANAESPYKTPLNVGRNLFRLLSSEFLVCE